MKTLTFFHSIFLALSYVATAQSVCSNNLLIDDYSNYLMHLNSLGYYTSGMFCNVIEELVMLKRR
jgi:hypothetical protein